MKTLLRFNCLHQSASLLALCVSMSLSRGAGPQAFDSTSARYTVTRLAGPSNSLPLLPTAINGRGQVIGAWDDSSGRVTSFFWDRGVFTDLGTVAAITIAKAINDRGQVIGFWEFSDGHWSSFLWERGVFTDLVRGTNESFRALAINRRGEIAGDFSIRPNGASRAAVWKKGVFTELPASSNATAFALNDHGQAVGWVRLGDEDPRPLLWNKKRTIELGSLGGLKGEAYAINNRGQIVGTSMTAAGVYHPFLWHKGRMIDLLPASEFWTYALAINERGQVMGDSGARVFFWEKGVLTDIGTLGGDVTYPAGMNDCGQIIGESQTLTSELAGFLWEKGVMTPLVNPADGTSFHPVAINNRGQIVGQDAQGAALWTPHRRKP